jgi:hypothetical protein
MMHARRLPQFSASKLRISPGSHSANTSNGRQHTSQSVVNRWLATRSCPPPAQTPARKTGIGFFRKLPPGNLAQRPEIATVSPEKKRAGNLPALPQSGNDFRARLKPLREGHGDGVALRPVLAMNS